jgi:predicted regulator of Ras-like GTPase activity (Roadblock/LC7/MglB family)
LKQKINAEIETKLPDGAAVISVGNDSSSFTNLSSSLAEIRKLNGVIGYILRSNTSAIIDLTDQHKVIEYAILSSQIAESSSEIAKQLNLSDMESVLVEGKTVKVLCMNLSENRISVFMDKNATHDGVIKRILL